MLTQDGYFTRLCWRSTVARASTGAARVVAAGPAIGRALITPGIPLQGRQHERWQVYQLVRDRRLPGGAYPGHWNGLCGQSDHFLRIDRRWLSDLCPGGGAWDLAAHHARCTV